MSTDRYIQVGETTMEHAQPFQPIYAKLSASQQMALNWQPIATAPRDGSQILVTDARVQEFWQVVSWETGENDLRTGWTDAEGSLCYHPEAFTDWMPLPTPPQR